MTYRQETTVSIVKRRKSRCSENSPATKTKHVQVTGTDEAADT